MLYLLLAISTFNPEQISAMIEEEIIILRENQRLYSFDSIGFTSINNKKVEVFNTNLPLLISEPNVDIGTWLYSNIDNIFLFTSKTNWEICSFIYKSEDNRFALYFSTVKSSIVCKPLDLAPKGFINTGSFIHTHSKGPIVSLNPVDYTIYGDIGFAMYVEPELFSDQDRLNKDVWLITPKRKLFHLNNELSEVHHEHTNVPRFFEEGFLFKNIDIFNNKWDTLKTDF